MLKRTPLTHFQCAYIIHRLTKPNQWTSFGSHYVHCCRRTENKITPMNYWIFNVCRNRIILCYLGMFSNKSHFPFFANLFLTLINSHKQHINTLDTMSACVCVCALLIFCFTTDDILFVRWASLMRPAIWFVCRCRTHRTRAYNLICTVQTNSTHSVHALNSIKTFLWVASRRAQWW